MKVWKPEIISTAKTRKAEALEGVRRERDARLSDSDWTQLMDNRDRMTGEQLAAWQAYRQALRDLPATIEDPNDITWPVRPL